jgi:ATP-dependent RNA helicase DDX47/RRP3
MEKKEKEIKSFKDLGLSEELIEACDKLGWKTPLKIQIQAIPPALQGSMSSMLQFLKYYSFYEVS